MSEIFSLIFFFITTYGLGYWLTCFLKKRTLETSIFRIAVGLGTIPVLGVLLNILRIPLDWRIFLGLGLFGLFDDLYRNRLSLSKPAPKIPYGLLVLSAIFIFCLVIYCNAPFRYPWLENDDPWGHAGGIKYVSIEKNLNAPPGEFHYLNPYPPGYNLLLGLLHQTSPSLYWTMKFFNGLIVSLGLLFFYIFAKTFLRDRPKAILATLFLSIIPCYLTHFIWAHSLVVTLFFPAFYAFLKSDEDKKFTLPAAVICAGLFLTQPTQSVKFVLMLFLLWFSLSLSRGKVNKTFFLISLTAVLLSSLWYGPVMKDTLARRSFLLLRDKSDISAQPVAMSSRLIQGLFNPAGGTATRAYTLADYVFVPKENYINNPIGMGVALFFLSWLGMARYILLLRKGRSWERFFSASTLLWLSFTFLGMNSKTFNLPVGLFAFRFWMLFAIPASILSAESAHYLYKVLGKKRILQRLFVFLMALGILTSAIYPKYEINVKFPWSFGVYWYSFEEVMAYARMRAHLPPDTKVFSFTDNILVLGHDMRADFWREDYKTMAKNAFNQPLDELHQNLKSLGFEYLTIGGKEAAKIGRNEVIEKIQALTQNPLFRHVYSIRNGASLFQIL